MKICLLTGCANGIGRHMAGLLLQQGHTVVATDVAISQLHTAATTDGWPTDRTLLLPLDVRSATDWQATMKKVLEQFGRLDVGMNIAGVIRPGYAAEIRPDDVDFMVDINLKGVMLGTRFMAEIMQEQRSGQIVNVASLAGVAPIQGLGIYSATKFGVRAFSIAASGELRDSGVSVSVVCPDLVNTDMLTAQLDHPEAALTFSGPRVLTVADVGRAILLEAIDRRRVEVMIPPSRGLLAKLGNFFPEWGFAVTKGLRKKGLKKQKELGGKLFYSTTQETG
ncbi:MAG: SDR family oxidoreductase [Cytophagales bacterium]|nr:MAG: SDR family oxidoreductase [Cytophagales bacterium]